MRRSPASRSEANMKKNLLGFLARAGITVAAAGLFLLIRLDIAVMLQQKVQAAMIQRASPGVIEAYLRNNPVRKLQIGAGTANPAGWLNTDIEPQKGQAYLDASKPFPLPDRAFRYVYSEQVIEHLTYEEGLLMLRESYRILEPGGKARIATPNLDSYIEMFHPGTPEAQRFLQRKADWQLWPKTPDPACYILNRQLHDWGHQFVYTPKLLTASLESVGFRNIKRYQTGESEDPGLMHVESREHWALRDVDAYETMTFEATR
jgi:predicted SAM-dependent methyltransferase